MNHSRMTLAIIAILAGAALATVTFAASQQAMAYRHYHHQDDNHKSIKVDQLVGQENQCSGQSPDLIKRALTTPESSTVCINEGNNNATIER